MTLRLPVEDILPELRRRLAAEPAVILTAPPGSGKTTMVPPALLAEPWLAGRRILVLEPRRLAARLAAAFIARQRGEEVGQTIGYRVRFESRVSAATRIEVLTEGLFVRRLQADPELKGIGLVIFDEFHERSLDADLALALCLDAQRGLREDLKILLMSATLDTSPLSTLLGGAPVVEATGRSYPVSIEHRAATFAAQPNPQEIAARTAAAIRQVFREHPGDILAFLPGTGEIHHCHELLMASPPPAELNLQLGLDDSHRSAMWRIDSSSGVAEHLIVYPLYGDLSLADQAAAVQPDPTGRRRIILATSIAETSITIEGIHTVVDSGWQRRPRFDPNSGLSRLITQRISRAAATQRAGRAGRLGPGHCLRLWSPGEEQGLRPFEPPEILNADLSQLLLELACWGVQDPASLTWLDPPPPGPCAQARDLLGSLGALDQQGQVTALGRRINELPVHPRLGLMLLMAAEQGNGSLACDLAALLSERDIIKDRGKSADIDNRLEILRAKRRTGSSAPAPAGSDPAACRRVQRSSQQLQEVLVGLSARSAGEARRRPAGPPTAAICSSVKARRQAPKAKGPAGRLTTGELIALAYPDRIARRRPEGRGKYKLTSGRGAVLQAHDHLADQEYLAVAELDAGRSEGKIFLAAALAPEAILRLYGDRLRYREEIVWDRQTGMVKARSQVMLAELVLETGLVDKPDPVAVQAALLTAIRTHGLQMLPWTKPARDLQARLASIRHWQPDGGWPKVDDEALGRDLEQWLGPWLEGIRSAEQLGKLDLVAILAGLLDYQRRAYLEREVPTHLTVPSGSRRKLLYRPGEAPVLAVRLQEMFGLADTPKIVAKRVPVLLHLLSPAGRPVQITTDLRGFWENAYREVKKELKGRYPKHHWPDDPWQAQPTARIKPHR